MTDLPPAGTYTYAAISPGAREWESKQGGKFTDFRVKLEGFGDTVFVRTVKGHGEDVKAPVRGQTVNVKEFKDNGQYPPKIVVDYSTGGGYGGGGKNGDFRSPDQIMRGYALHSAVELAAHVDHKQFVIGPAWVLELAEKFYAFQKGDS